MTSPFRLIENMAKIGCESVYTLLALSISPTGYHDLHRYIRGPSMDAFGEKISAQEIPKLNQTIKDLMNHENSPDDLKFLFIMIWEFVDQDTKDWIKHYIQTGRKKGRDWIL